MPRYAVFTATETESALRHGTYSQGDAVDALPSPLPPDTLFVDRTTGAIHGSARPEETDLFTALEIPEVGARLDATPCTIALTRYDATEFGPMIERVLGRPLDPERPGIIDGVTRESVIALLIEALSRLGEANSWIDTTAAEPGSERTIRDVIGDITVLKTLSLSVGETYLIDYTNYEGRRSVREIRITGFAFGANLYHPTPVMMIEAVDVARDVPRTFATDARSRIHSIVPHAGIDDRVADIVA